MSQPSMNNTRMTNCDSFIWIARTHLIQMQTTRVRVCLLKNDLDLSLTLMCDLDLINGL